MLGTCTGIVAHNHQQEARIINATSRSRLSPSCSPSKEPATAGPRQICELLLVEGNGAPCDELTAANYDAGHSVGAYELVMRY